MYNRTDHPIIYLNTLQKTNEEHTSNSITNKEVMELHSNQEISVWKQLKGYHKYIFDQLLTAAGVVFRP